MQHDERHNKKTCILGTGGFGRETLCCLMDTMKSTDRALEEIACFMVEDEYYEAPQVMGIDVIPLSKFDPSKYDVVVAIGDPLARKKVISRLPDDTQFATIIHPNALISKWVTIGEGSIITAGAIVTCNITIGKHAHINLNTTIGHDCVIGDFFTTAPGVNISGNCRFGDCVYFGTNSSVKERVSICDNVIIGMGGVVVKEIMESGVYIGNPLKKLDNRS